MSNRTSRSRRFTSALVLGLVLVGGGIAFAYWTVTGSGSGTGATGDNAAITINQTSTVTNLRPGGPAQELEGDFTNTNGGPVYVTSVTASIASVTKAAGAPTGTCDATDYTLTGATMTVDAEVPAGANQGSWSGATIAFNNKATNQDACKGATVNLAYTSA